MGSDAGATPRGGFAVLPLTFGQPVPPVSRWRPEPIAAWQQRCAAARAGLDRVGFVPSEPAEKSAATLPAPPSTPAASHPTAEARPALEELERELIEAAERAAADGVRFPTAAEYAAMSDAEIARLRADVEALAADDDDRIEFDFDVEAVRQHPVDAAMEHVQTAQAALRKAEAARVGAALTAWRTALASVTGTPDLGRDSLFHQAVMLQLAHDLQVAEVTASALVHSAADLEVRMPRCWRLFRGGAVPWRGMQMLHAAIDGLDEEFWPAMDERAARIVDRVAMPKLRARLLSIRERIQARTAAERHRSAMQRMGVTIEPAPDGMATLTATLPAAEAIEIDRRLDAAAVAAASVEGETRGIAQLRAHVLIDVVDEGLCRDALPAEHGGEGLAVPQRRGVQVKVGLLIPAMTLLGRSDVPAQLEGYGPVDPDTAARLAGNATSWIKVLTDPVTGAVMDIGRDRYRPTADMRALLGILDRGGRGPNCTRPPGRTEADHVEEFHQGLARGRTAIDNLVLLSRRDHAVKTSGLWDIELRPDRALVWTSSFGTRIITTVEPLEPTPVPPDLLAPVGAADRAGPDPDPDCPF